ncbi:MAG TPA: TIGR03086 family metal-binding protein [Amycolatopsis sp.]|jgi:uncharacterized protein (TIGR03086 family)|nr:TIGR03086 family metal-binding protein [Amycolatopsis sp.]
MDTLQLHCQAQDDFAAVLTVVPDDHWTARTPCPAWSVRDVAGHAVWGQHQLRAWALGEDYDQSQGGPGTAHPGVHAGIDPLARWREASTACLAALTPESLTRVITLPGLGEVPIAGLVALLTTDLVAHTWDIGHAVGADVALHPDTVAAAFAWARAHAVRRPGFFGPELAPPADADDRTRLMAFLGRAAWEPVTT